ncbi:DegV family protein [Mycoplasmatota bacterium]|nr:DegV family protein [Mycoplasmatota bacterium]
MRRIAIIIDSTCYLDEKFIKENNIEVVSLNVIIDGVSYKETDIDNKVVFDSLKENKKVSTAQVAPGLFVEAYNKLIDEGVEDILVFPISSGLSGTYQAACIAKKMVEGNIHIFDSKVAAYGVELIVLQVVELINQNKSNEEVIERAKLFTSNGHVLFTLTTLDHVVRGGRISKMSALIGNTLRIKPVIEMIDGKLEVTKKSRTNKRIIDNFIVEELYKESLKFKRMYLRIINLKQEDIALEIEHKILNKIPNIEVSHTNYIGPVFSYHLGDEGYGITWTAE